MWQKSQKGRLYRCHGGREYELGSDSRSGSRVMRSGEHWSDEHFKKGIPSRLHLGSKGLAQVLGYGEEESLLGRSKKGGLGTIQGMASAKMPNDR